MARSTVVINGKLYDVATGKPVDCGIKKKPISHAKHAKNVVRRPKASSAASRATYQKPAIIAKPEHNVAGGAVPTAAIAPNPVITAKPEPKSTPKKPRKSSRRKILIEVIVAIIIVVFAGVIAALYMPSFSVRIAGNSAGVNSKYPTYRIEGFGVDGGIKSEPGQITINYRNNKTGDTYSISQRSSNWDSDSLLENQVKLSGESYETIAQKGLTIYKYGNTTAWVNGGVLFTIDDNSNHDINQILQIIDGI